MHAVLIIVGDKMGGQFSKGVDESLALHSQNVDAFDVAALNVYSHVYTSDKNVLPRVCFRFE